MSILFNLIWGVIGIWSLAVVIKEFISWVKWKPDDDRFVDRFKSVIIYRFKMLFRMIIPTILALVGLAILLL